MVSGEPLKRRL